MYFKRSFDLFINMQNGGPAFLVHKIGLAAVLCVFNK